MNGATRTRSGLGHGQTQMARSLVSLRSTVPLTGGFEPGSAVAELASDGTASPRTPKQWHTGFGSGALAVALIAVAFAMERGRLLAAEPIKRPMRETATVVSDTSVQKRLGTIEDYLADRRWVEAADMLHEIAQTDGRSLVLAQPGQAGGTAVYLNVATRCQVLLSRMPPEGLIAYRRKVDPLAKRWFENWQRTRDRAELERLVRQVYLSSYGDDALWSLGEAAWDRGDFAAARLFWSQIVALPEAARAANLPTVLRYPDSDLEPASVLSRLVLCSLMEGNRVRAFEEQRLFSELYPQTVGSLAGRHGRLAELLKQILEESVAWDASPQEGEATTFGLAPERTQILPSVIDVGAPRWHQPLTPNLLPPFDRPRASPDRGPLSTHPVVFRDLVLVNDADSISAFNLLTGEPAWPTERGTAQIYPPVPDERAPSPERQSVGVPWFTMTVADGKLFARLGSPVTNPSEGELRDLTSELVCLDLADGQGRLVWKIAANEWHHDSQRPWRFEGSPVVRDGRAYVIHSRRRPQLEFAVSCLDAAKGERVWTRTLATSRTSIEDHHNRVSHLLPTLGAGKLFVSTDAGVIVAVDAQDGRVEWAVTYESRLPTDVADQSDHSKQGLTPAMFHEGLLFVAPNDCDRLLCIEADSGRVRWQKMHPSRDRWRHLLGVASSDEGTRLIVSGHSLKALDVATGRDGWSISASRDPAERGYGRGVLAGDAILWPMREELRIVDAATGQPRRSVPLNTPDSAESGGNVLIAGGMLLIAQPNKLVAYGEYSLLKERLHRELSSRPDKSQLLFKLAEIEASAGNLHAAAKAAHTARQRHDEEPPTRSSPSSAPAPHEETQQQRHAARLSELLRRAARQKATQGHTDEALTGLIEALALASKPVARAEVLFELASVEQMRQRPEAAVEHWQQILQEARLRSAVRREAVGQMNSGSEAAAAIKRLIGQHGRKVYASVEQRAAREIATHVADREAAALRETLAQFPHAETARRAWLTLAALEREAGHVAAACSIFARLVDEEGLPAEQATALVSWAEALELAGYWRAAHLVWLRFNDRFADTMVEQGELTRRAYDLARERLARPEYRSYEQTSSAPIAFLERAWTVSLLPRASLAANVVSRADVARAMPFVPQGEPPSKSLACVLVHRDIVSSGDSEPPQFERKLECLDRESGRVRWQLPFAERPCWVAYAETHLLVATDDALSALTLESGERLWSVARRTSGQTKQKSLAQFEVRGRWVIEFEPRSGVRLIDARTGDHAWSFQPPGRMQREWSCGTDHIALQTIQPATTWLLEIAGERRAAELPGHTEPWRRPPMTDDVGRVTVVTDTRRVESLVPDIAAPVWTYRGGMSFAHVDPVAWSAHGHLLLTVDGTTLKEIHRETGRTLWSAGLTDWPLTDPAHQVIASETTVFVASRGIVRALSLQNGQQLWEQFVGEDSRSNPSFRSVKEPALSVKTGQWNVALCGPLVAAWPMTPTGSELKSVCFCAANSGRIVQRCRLNPATTLISVAASVAGDSTDALVVTDREVVALCPIQATHTARVP